MSKNKSITEEALVAIVDEKLSPIMQTVNYLNGSVKLLSEKFDNVCKKIESLDKELKDVKSENRHLKSEVLRLSGVVDQQKSELNIFNSILGMIVWRSRVYLRRKTKI
jgi:cell shape-determining protein MreC